MCIVIVDIDRGKVKLGFMAPRDIPISRDDALPPGFTHRYLPAAPAEGKSS